MRRFVLGSLLCITFGMTPAQSQPAPPGAERRSEHPPLTFENLESRLDAEARAGLSGSVLVVRGDRIVLSRGYGWADRDKKIAATPETVYGIGSTPIDFTRAGILLLAQDGKLRLEDPITKYFADVPDDKRAITLEHLMSGRSGLQDFHDLPADRDPDHAWIDREEAMRRILAQKLLFEPGKGDEHSHSAWGVLAAVIEIVSGETYPEFTRRRLFEPAGMKDTGFFGAPIAPERMAIGYGPRSDGEINAPPYWGRTSWLVMGSGGQVSTTLDLHRWHAALRAGRILQSPWLEQYWAPPGAVLAGGDMYGFEIVYTQGPGDQVIIIGNGGHGPRSPGWQPLTRDLVQLVQAGSAPKFALGLQMEPTPDGRVRVVRVVSGSAAERDGILAGDLLLAADGRALGADAAAVLRPHLESGAAVEFDIERGGEHRRIRVTPKRRE